jgi:hypothetical protein
MVIKKSLNSRNRGFFSFFAPDPYKTMTVPNSRGPQPTDYEDYEVINCVIAITKNKI